MAIILILVGFTSPLIGYIFRHSSDCRVRAEIKSMENALEAYKADNGSYPPLDPGQMDGSAPVAPKIHTNFVSQVTPSVITGPWTNSRFIYQALTAGPKAYIVFKPHQLIQTNLDGVACNLIKDPYGRPYGYNPANPLVNPGSFDLWSAGPDNKSSYPTNLTLNSDDTGNWR
jgi:hypothetical protein